MVNNVSDHFVDTSTSTPIYEEIQPSFSQAPNKNKCNQEGLELQENTAFTTLKLQENAAYQTTVDIKLKRFELHENAAYICTTYEHFEFQEDTACCNTVTTQK